MKKKDYIQPTMIVVKIKMQGHLLIDSVTTSGADGLDGYDDNGGNQEYAW